MPKGTKLRRRDFLGGAALAAALPSAWNLQRCWADSPLPENGAPPEVYFLQEAVRRGFSAIAARLDRQQACRPYFALELQPKALLKHEIWDLGDMCARYVDAWILGRQMTGYDDDREEERALRKLLHETADPFAHRFMSTRMLLTFVDEYLEEPCAEREARVRALVAQIQTKLTVEEDYAFWTRRPAGWQSMTQPIYGDFEPYPTHPLGGTVLALARFVETVRYPEGERLLDRLSTFILEKSGTFDREGRFRGHTHSGGILTAAVGLLRWALHKGDAATVARMQGAFDWCAAHSSSWGWVPDGLGQPDATCETCSLTDAIHLALLLARHVDPAYYDTAERYARNQLMENQFRDPERAVPPGDDPMRAQVARALDGSWASWALPNSLDSDLEHGVEGCCLGSGIRGAFLVWEHAIARRGETVQVNLGVSRNSPWVQVTAFEPYAGRLEIVVHDAPKLQVRIPAWAPAGELRVSLDQTPVAPVLDQNRYLTFVGLAPGSTLRIEYPLVSRRAVETLRGQAYESHWEGGTVVAITPAGTRYPLYTHGSRQAETVLSETRLFSEQTGGPVHW